MSWVNIDLDEVFVHWDNVHEGFSSIFPADF